MVGCDVEEEDEVGGGETYIGGAAPFEGEFRGDILVGGEEGDDGAVEVMTFDADKAIPENAYLSQIIVVPPLRRVSIVDLLRFRDPRKSELEATLGERLGNLRHFPTIRREEEVDGVVVEFGG